MTLLFWDRGELIGKYPVRLENDHPLVWTLPEKMKDMHPNTMASITDENEFYEWLRNDAVR